MTTGFFGGRTAARPAAARPALARPALARLAAALMALLLLMGAHASLGGGEARAATAPPGEVRVDLYRWDTGDYRATDLRAGWSDEHVVVYVEEDARVPFHLVGDLGEELSARSLPRLLDLFQVDPGEDLSPGAGAVWGDHRVAVVLYEFGPTSVRGYMQPADLGIRAGGGPLVEDTGETPVVDSIQRNPGAVVYLDVSSFLLDPAGTHPVTAHEAAHVLQLREALGTGDVGDPIGDGRWLSEGIAVFAERHAGHGGRFDDFVQAFAEEPRGSLTRWRGYSRDYGAAASFVEYLARRHGDGVVAELARRAGFGMAAVTEAVGSRDGSSAREAFGDWVVDLAEGTGAARPRPRAPEGRLPVLGGVSLAPYAFELIELEAPELSAEGARFLVDGPDGRAVGAAALERLAASVYRATPMSTNNTHSEGTAGAEEGAEAYGLALWRAGESPAVDEIMCRYSIGPDGGAQYMDVDGDHRFFDYIARLTGAGIVDGRPLTEGSSLPYFFADDPIYRAQFAKMAVGAVGLHTDEIEPAGDVVFPDVGSEPSSYPYDYVYEASRAGIVHGFRDGSFRPWERLSRIQLVRMILRAAEAAGSPVPRYTGSEAVFADVPPGADIYADVMTAYEAGIMSGRIDEGNLRRFEAWNPATRGHVAKMTANLLEGVGS